MTVDNFDLFRSRLDFRQTADGKTFDRYIVHILRRAKDLGGGGRSKTSMLKTYEISSLEYFDKKRPLISELCRLNSARAYILPQVRSTRDCLKALIRESVESLDSPDVRLGNMLRSCVAGMHSSRDKMWVLDLDDGCMTERLYDRARVDFTDRVWSPDDVMTLVKDSLSKCGKDPSRAYFVPTKSGRHIVTPPFDLQAVAKECGLMFEGEKKAVVDVKWTGPGEYELIEKKITGWLHKDGMSLLYYSDRKD